MRRRRASRRATSISRPRSTAREAAIDGIDAATQYRVPTQTSMDGNTVELNQEQTAFAENAVQYQTTLSFLNGRIGQITRALKGE